MKRCNNGDRLEASFADANGLRSVSVTAILSPLEYSSQTSAGVHGDILVELNTYLNPQLESEIRCDELTLALGDIQDIPRISAL